MNDRTPAAVAATAATATAADGFTAGDTDPIARTLSAFVHGLRLEDVPAAVSLRARHLLLDAIGCGLAARREDFAERYATAVHALAGGAGTGRNAGGAGGGRSAVIGFDERLPVRDAALLNGVLTHGLDYDDTHMAGVVHLTVGILPAVLAGACHRDMSGAELLSAYIAAMEAGARIASVVQSGFHAQGFHPTGVVGAFTSALACGRLLGLDAAGLRAAQGVALSFTSGNLQFIEDGAWTKRVHPGWAAQAGITAATFAAHGIVAPGAPYTGRYGLYRSHLGETLRGRADLALGTAGLAEEVSQVRVGTWEIENVAVKPFPVCHFVHASADAAIALHRQGVDCAAIRAVEVRVPAGVVQSVCEPIASKRRPRSDYDAKFSLPYGVASGLLRGRLGLQELVPAAYEDPVALALMERTSYVEDPESTFPRHYTGEVRVTLDDGRTLIHREAVNRGHAERPLTNAEVLDKFMANATLNFPRSHAEAIAGQVLALDRLPSVRALEDLLGRDPARLD